MYVHVHMYSHVWLWDKRGNVKIKLKSIKILFFELTQTPWLNLEQSGKSQGSVTKLDFCPFGFLVLKLKKEESSFKTNVPKEILSVLNKSAFLQNHCF